MNEWMEGWAGRLGHRTGEGIDVGQRMIAEGRKEGSNGSVGVDDDDLRCGQPH